VHLPVVVSNFVYHTVENCRLSVSEQRVLSGVKVLRREMQQEGGEDCIISSLIICTSYQILDR